MQHSSAKTEQAHCTYQSSRSHTDSGEVVIGSWQKFSSSIMWTQMLNSSKKPNSKDEFKQKTPVTSSFQAKKPISGLIFSISIFDCCIFPWALSHNFCSEHEEEWTWQCITSAERRKLCFLRVRTKDQKKKCFKYTFCSLSKKPALLQACR